MRKVSYIFGLLLCVFFFSCEKEEFIADSDKEEPGNDFYINPEDTAGIVVPDGYSLVIFPGDKAMTRAGSETRIRHLQYIIYQKDGNGDYIQYEANKIIKQDLSSWPLKAEVTSLPKGYTYKVVFLGNIDKGVFGANQTTDVLTGTGKGENFTNARILLPNVEFSDYNMYFFDKAEFNTNNAAAYVPITLKRIVSRNDITKAGLSSGYTAGVTDNNTYIKAYWNEIIREKMKETIFTGEKSAFRYQLAEALKKNMIYPLVYIGLNDPSDATSLGSSYSVVKQYNIEWETNKPTDAQLSLLYQLRTSFDLVSTDYPKNLCIRYAQYLYDTFIEEESKDPLAVTTALKAIFADNIEYIHNGISDGNCIDLAVDKTIEAIRKNYGSGVLLPWRMYTYSVVDISDETPIPGAVDFNLDVDATHNLTGEKYYRVKDAASNITDKYISIISLGEPQSSTRNLKISKIYEASSGGTTINFSPSTKNEIVGVEFTTGGFKRNIKNVTTQHISDVNLLNTKLLTSHNDYKQKIEVNYYHVFQAMNPVNGTNNTGFTLGNSGSDAKFTIEGISFATGGLAHMQSYILNILNYKYIAQEMSDYEKHSFPFVTFTCPDISSTNLKVTTEWKTEEVVQ